MRLIGFAVVLAIGSFTTSSVSEPQVSWIGFISTISPGSAPTTDVFRQGLRELRYPQSILFRADEVIQ